LPVEDELPPCDGVADGFWLPDDDEPVGARVEPVASGPELWPLWPALVEPEAARDPELLEDVAELLVDERDSVDWRTLLRSETPVLTLVRELPPTDTPTPTRRRSRTAMLGSLSWMRVTLRRRTTAGSSST
jgi:hypothetical protein